MSNNYETKYAADIDKACENFRELLIRQLNRQKTMEENQGKKDFASLDKIVIGTIGGDGIGPAITAHAVTLLEYLLKEEIEAGKIEIKNIEGLTIENREAQGKAVPDDIMAEIKSCDVLLKGPTTTPKGGTMESANVTNRFLLAVGSLAVICCIFVSRFLAMHMTKPVKELKQFEKVFLKAGESKKVTFNITDEDLNYYNPMLHKWVVENGAYDLYLCASSRDVRLRVRLDYYDPNCYSMQKLQDAMIG